MNPPTDEELVFVVSPKTHWTVLGLSLLVTIIAILASVEEEEVVIVGGKAVPPICWFKQATGMDCAGCGMTRSFVHLAHGHLRTAVAFHPFGPLLFFMLLMQIPYRTLTLVRRGWEGRHPAPGIWGWRIFVGIVVLAFAHWLLGMLGVSP